MSAGTGLFVIPAPIFNGADAPTGLFTVPMVVCEGHGASYANFKIPLARFTGTAENAESRGEYRSPVPTFSGTGSSPIMGSGVFISPGVVFSGIVAGVGRGTFTVPMPVFSDIIPGHGRGLFDIPIVGISGFGRSLSLSKIYRGIVMNISNQAISTYSGFNFNSLAYFNENYYGANENGIFRLGGNKDNLTRDILAKIKTGAMNFGDNTLKYVRDVWLTYRTDGHLQMTFLVDEDEDITSVSRTEYVADNIREERLKCGRGLRGRFYTIVLENMSGSDFDIEQLSILVDAARRRVR